MYNIPITAAALTRSCQWRPTTSRIMIMVIRGKTSKCGNLLITPRALATLPPPPDASPHHSAPWFSPTTRRLQHSPCHFPWAGSVSMMPRPRFNLFSTPPRATMDYFPFVVFSFPPGGRLRSPAPLPHGKARCSRMRALDACVRALGRVRWCASVRVIIIRREQLYEEPTASDPFTLC